MTPKHLCILLLAAIAVGCVAGQSEDIPVENDNQFPPDNPVEPSIGEVLEGSGDGTIEEPITTNETTPAPQLEEVQSGILAEITSTAVSDGETCPKQCVCHTEGASENFVVDCSGYALTEFPSPLDSRTTTLKIQNNKLTEIPKDVASLKNLKVLNADNNMIMDLASGSVSELTELKVLSLANNRLIEFPKDLKNGFGLTKLEELDLGGNDMRTELKSEIFSNFKSLRKLTLPTSTSTMVEDLCVSLKETLETVCTGSCDEQTFECPDAPNKIDDDFLNADTLPGTISFNVAGEQEDADPAVQPPKVDDTNPGTEDTPQEKAADIDVATNSEVTEEPPIGPKDVVPTDGVGPGSRATNKDTEENVPIKHNSMVASDPKDHSAKIEGDVQVGATTTSTTTGGVDKSVIGIVVAGMVVVVAGIAIKRNWSSIKKRFSSSPRPPNDRGGANANGTTPEEVPLQDKQDKSPV